MTAPATEAPHIAKRAKYDWAKTPSGFLETWTFVNDDPTVLSDIQLELVDNTTSMFSIWRKSRGTGWSFAVAAQGFALAMNRKGYKRSFTSRNLDDAKRKIRYAKGLYESLPEVERRRVSLITDNKTELEWADGSRLYTEFKPRSEHDVDVVLDELAWIHNDDEVVTSAMGELIRSGRLQIGSTVLGLSGSYWEIETNQHGRYDMFRRYFWPWWLCPEQCRDVIEAAMLAPQMTTAERVAKYGSERLRALFSTMPLEDFQQEFEGVYQDDTTAWYSWELLKRCEMGAQEAEEWRCDSIEQLVIKQRGQLYAGFDVGRKRNTSELKIFDLVSDRAYERYWETYDNVEFPDQEERLDAILSTLRGRLERLRIDSRGMGGPIYEKLKRKHGAIVEGVEGTTPLKEWICTNVRMMMEADQAAFYPDTATLGQLHSIKRQLTAHGNYVFDSERNKKHHADKAWAALYALSGIPTAGSMSRPIVGTTSQNAPDVSIRDRDPHSTLLAVTPTKKDKPKGDPKKDRADKVKKVLEAMQRDPQFDGLSDYILRAWAEKTVEKQDA